MKRLVLRWNNEIDRSKIKAACICAYFLYYKLGGAGVEIQVYASQG